MKQELSDVIFSFSEFAYFSSEHSRSKEYNQARLFLPPDRLDAAFQGCVWAFREQPLLHRFRLMLHYPTKK